MSAKQPRIAIIGAGPAGLSAAYYLREQGYTNVLVLEKPGQVGGLCKSVTEDYQSFDLGANFTTKAYREVGKIARRYGLGRYSEMPFVAMDAPVDRSQPVRYSELFDSVREHDDGTKTGLLTFGIAVLYYIWLRHKLSSVIDAPAFTDLHKHPELCVSFEDWLSAQKLFDKDLNYYLGRLFLIPMTMMGYGQLRRTAAPYALKFMTNATFWPMTLKAIPKIGRFLTPWPKRFTHGFQRLWERVSWDLNVRTGVNVTAITRNPDAGIRIEYQRLDRDLSTWREEVHVHECDKLILACPLHPDVTSGFMHLHHEEHELFSKIQTYSYCMTTLHVRDLGIGRGMRQGSVPPLACVFPETDETLGWPWAIAKARPDSTYTQFYTRIGEPWKTDYVPRPFDEVRKTVVDNVHRMLSQMGMGASQQPTPENPDTHWTTFDRWPYFQHVSVDEVADNWYGRLAALQGVNSTYYVGGATNFELIEPIMQFTKDLVAEHFPRQR